MERSVLSAPLAAGEPDLALHREPTKDVFAEATARSQSRRGRSTSNARTRTKVLPPQSALSFAGVYTRPLSVL
jgi:hypothetical protein